MMSVIRTHFPGSWFWYWVVVGVPLLGLSVHLSVPAVKDCFHLRHAEGTHRRAARRSFIPADRQVQVCDVMWRSWGRSDAPPRLCVSPLRGEDAVEDGALPAVPRGLQDEHVLDDVEGEAVVGERTQQLSLQEGRPLLLQHSLTSFVTLKAKPREDFQLHY